ncbi:hypothetical protein Tdes44962_MAKER01306 [Teratosphaeria destructans]|uniref:Uncharacterized protein n=1 Tax=Teratosphaeria destructans TaxID=418781 RepID=A0A9W7T112_9PEZI|nr:hypothetical protein Tdes44962_MAKER01306 [Teratosphaeria destructans]
MSGAWMPSGRLRSVAYDKASVDRLEHGYPTHRRLRPGQNNRNRYGTWARSDVFVKAIALVLLAANLMLWMQRPKDAPQRPLADLQEPIHESLEAPISSSKLLYLAIPSRVDRDVDLCKTLLTAQILNYPVPDLIRWGQDEEGKAIAAEQMARAKLLSIQSWFERLPDHANDGIVILLSGPDSWFQLRPEVLLRRYYETIRGQSTGLDRDARRIIFAAEHECQHSADVSWQSPRPCQRFEDAYLSENIVIGPVSEVSALIDVAVDMTSKNDRNDTLAVFDEIFALQEADDIDQGQKLFQIGLDTQNGLGLLATNTIEARYYKDLEQSVHESMPPFWTPSSHELDMLDSFTWEDVRLLGNEEDLALRPPATIHFRTNNSAQSFVSEAEAESQSQSPASANSSPYAAPPREDLWPYLWLQPYARALYTAATLTPTTVIALVEDDQGALVKFWGEKRLVQKAGADDRLRQSFRRWDEICQGKEESQAIFLDLQGDWEAPLRL